MTADQPDLALPLFTAEIEVPIPNGEHVAFLRSVPSHGLSMGRIAFPRSVVMDMEKTGLVRADGLGSIHLTTCGRLCLRELERTL